MPTIIYTRIWNLNRNRIFIRSIGKKVKTCKDFKLDKIQGASSNDSPHLKVNWIQRTYKEIKSLSCANNNNNWKKRKLHNKIERENHYVHKINTPMNGKHTNIGKQINN